MLDTSNQRPDLMAPVHGHSENGTRILASLEHGGRLPARVAHATRWHLDGWTAGMTLAVLVVAVLAWKARESATHGEIRPAPESLAAPAVSRPQATGGATAMIASASSAATIVSLPEPQAPLRPDPTTLAASPPGRAAAKPAQPATASAATRTAAPAPAAHKAGTAPVPAPAAVDTDVALLAAMVAHTGKPAHVNPERSRDVVLPQEGEGTTLLLARCKQLGLIEGMLCRSRICSGQWESDPACRAPAH